MDQGEVMSGFQSSMDHVKQVPQFLYLQNAVCAVSLTVLFPASNEIMDFKKCSMNSKGFKNVR